MNEPLQAWYSRWLHDNRGTDLLYVNKSPRDEVSLHQVHFVRDSLARLFWADHKYDALPVAPPRTWWEHNTVTGEQTERISDGDKDLVRVVGVHHSKSVELPVYMIEREDLGLKVVLRDNYHDWNVTVVSSSAVDEWVKSYGATSLTSSERAKYCKGGYWDYLFFQGFPSEYCLGPWDRNPRAFSIALAGGEHELYAFCRELTAHIRALPKKHGYRGTLSASAAEQLGVEAGKKVCFNRHWKDALCAVDIREPYGRRLGGFIDVDSIDNVEVIR